MDLSEKSLRKYEHSIHDPISKVLIPVKTSADSRIGQFALSHGLSSHAFDELLALLEDPEIRGSEITISSGESFFRAVAEHRERLQLKRSVSPLGFSPVVLDGVIEAMRQDMGSFVEAIPGYELDFPNEDASESFDTLIHTLENMALVHRSWADPVHRLLHMRYYVSGRTIPKPPPPRTVAAAIRELAVDYEWRESNASLWSADRPSQASTKPPRALDRQNDPQTRPKHSHHARAPQDDRVIAESGGAAVPILEATHGCSQDAAAYFPAVVAKRCRTSRSCPFCGSATCRVRTRIRNDCTRIF